MNRLELGPVAYAACWVGIWLVHAVASAYYATVAAVYWNLNHLYVGVFLDGYNIGIGEEYYPTVSAVHGACAVVHAFSATRILTNSLESRLQCSCSALSCRITRSSMKSKVSSYLQGSAWMSTLVTLGSQIFGNEGLLGVNGKWYGAILVARELLELSLQTVQAFKMSKLLSSAIPTDFYTSLLVGNCWTTAWIRVQLGAHAVREHFFSLLLDCVLDVVTVVGLSVVIATPYIVNDKWTFGGFWDNILASDEKVKQATMELQFVSVSSRSDLISRVVFAIGLIYTLGDMKILLRTKPIRKNRRGIFIGLLLVIPKPRKPVQLVASRASVAPIPFSPLNNSLGEKTRPHPARKGSMLVSFAFVIWGIALLVLQLYARSIPHYSQCSFQVRPWGARVPSCYFANLDCFELGIRGVAEEVMLMWRKFERSTTETLHILHCPSLELSPLMRDFSNLVSLKMYNTSITKWDIDAAISGTDHPQISYIELARVTFANATLPQGLLSTDVPWSLKQVNICVSNLNRLPANLGSLWPPGMQVAIELSELYTINDALIQLRPYSLSLFGNPLHTVPAALFEIEGLNDLNLGNTSLQNLPEQVNALSSSLTFIFFCNTNVTAFWAWIDPLVYRSVDSAIWAILAGGTPYCSELSRILNGSVSSFVAFNTSNTQYSILMDPDKFLSDIQEVLSCDSGFAFLYSTLTMYDEAFKLTF